MAKGAIQARKKRARKASKEQKAKRPFWKAKRFTPASTNRQSKDQT